MTQPGTSPGYAMIASAPSGGMEFLTDPDGNGQLNASVAGGTSSTPKWLKLSRRGAEVLGVLVQQRHVVDPGRRRP